MRIRIYEWFDYPLDATNQFWTTRQVHKILYKICQCERRE